jgi:signal transduction histidine kinase
VSARTYEIERRRRIAEGLRDILAMLNADRPTAEVLDNITAQASRLLDAPVVAVHSLTTNEPCFVLESGHGSKAYLADIGRMQLHSAGGAGDCVAAFVRRPCVIRDTAAFPTAAPDPDLEGACSWLTDLPAQFRACICLPVLIGGGQVYGSLSLYYTHPQAFSEEDISLAQSLSDRVSLAIENSQLRRQAEQAAVIQERNRIARDLHDSVSQALYGISLGANTLLELLAQQRVDDGVRAALTGPLDYVLLLAKRALAEMRALILELRPDVLEDEGLVAALTRQAMALRARHELAVVTDFCDEPDLPIKVKEALYRVAQEALSNVLKHADAAQAILRLRYTDEGIVLEICDDGIGFDTQREYPGHIGLLTMRERVAQLGGDIQITSRPGQGTTIQVCLDA